jgi:hypothetical protein
MGRDARPRMSMLHCATSEESFAAATTVEGELKRKGSKSTPAFVIVSLVSISLGGDGAVFLSRLESSLLSFVFFRLVQTIILSFVTCTGGIFFP